MGHFNSLVTFYWVCIVGGLTLIVITKISMGSTKLLWLRVIGLCSVVKSSIF